MPSVLIVLGQLTMAGLVVLEVGLWLTGAIFVVVSGRPTLPGICK
jgi:hypothetical protein